MPAGLLGPAFPQRSPPWLFATAACGGLRSTPDCRPRRALLHLSYSCIPPCGPAILVTQDPYATSGKPLLDRLGGNSEHARWNGEAARFCGHGAVRPIASRNPRRLLSSKLLQSSSGECRLNSAVLRARRIA